MFVRACVRACLRGACVLTSYDTPLILIDAWLTGPSRIVWVQFTANMTRVVNKTSVRLHTETHDFKKLTAVHIFKGGSSFAIDQLLYVNLRKHKKQVGDWFKWSIWSIQL